MSDNSFSQTVNTPIPEITTVSNLNSRTDTMEYSNPVLTRAYEKDYSYRFVKDVKQQRNELEDHETYNEIYDIPYHFIIAILKYLVHNVGVHRDEIERGEYPQTLLLAESKKRGIAIAVLVTVRDYHVTVLSAERVPLSEFESKKLRAYALERKLFLKDLDLDAYVESKKENKKTKRQNIAKKFPSFWEDEVSGLTYRFSCTKHLKEERSNTSGERLTIPIAAVKDILRYAMEHAASALQEYIGTSVKEKQLVLVFPSLDKSHNVGILIAIDDLLITVISMYDVPPSDKGLNTLIFPNAKRIVLADYDLADFMEGYILQERERIVLRDKMLEEQLAVARKQGSGIKTFSSLNEYDKLYVPKRVQKIVSAGKMSKGLKKITIVEKIKPVKQEDKREIKVKEKLRQSALLGLSAKMIKAKVDKHGNSGGKKRKKKRR
jgi:hypothetical protein